MSDRSTLGRRIFGAGERDFRWRGTSVSRLEALSDAVFALALTLIVVTLDVPATFDELLEVFVQAPVFAACFAILMMFWFFHHRFHRRYGLEDGPTMLLEAVLLFLVLLYVYPLRFLASFLHGRLVLGRSEGPGVTWGEMQALMIVYGGGFALVFAIFALLHARAWSLRAELELDSVERVQTKAALHSHLLSAGVGALSATIAALDARWVGVAGFSYLAMGPMHGLHGWLTGRAVARYRGKVPGAPFADSTAT
jgi:uncharacterized membrane protein